MTKTGESSNTSIPGGSIDTKLVEHVGDPKTKKAAYAKQTQAAEAKGESNCPLCAVGHDANKSRIYTLDEMDADHVAAWSKHGDSSAKNCSNALQDASAREPVTI